MLFGVIVSIDVPRCDRLRNHLPRRSLRKAMDQTEGDECGEYDYLGGVWHRHHHRKYVGVLTREQFDKLVEDCDLQASDVTVVSLGVPWLGSGFGIAPAISFDVRPVDGRLSFLASAYVTPLLDRVRESRECTEEDWERVKAIIVRKYS